MPGKSPIPFDPTKATTAQVAAVCGITPEGCLKWKGSIDSSTGIWREVKGGRGRAGIMLVWDLPRLLEWRTEHAVASAIERIKPAATMSPLEQEQLRKMQLQNGEREGALVNRAELDRQWAKAGGELRQRLETVGRRHGPAVANDLARVMADLARSVHGLLGKT